ncbi:MAG: undecaprenyl-diphosphatase UppP [Desulfobulbaceae bacterium]|nr:undecaprenyl-diphosphatase UppP [Desulfobulbaceae bacterium]HIJ78443.1 undecaprenyl-diphosphatase UppP [Deltaproteobacteria bacterium]
MNFFEAIIFGLIQGATEFLPISSSGHLVLAHALFGTDDVGLAYDVALHLGTLLAILIYFFTDFWQIAKALIGGHQDPAENTRLRLLAAAICVGTIPGVIAGLLLGDMAEEYFRNPLMVALSLTGFGLLLLVADKTGKRSRDLKELTMVDAIIIGLSQALAIIPGVSRSGITITSGLFANLNRQAAVRFSFLLSAPIIAGAGVYKIPEIISQGVLTDQAGYYLAGFLSSAVSGYLFIAFLMRFIKARSFAIFSYYRFGLAALVVTAYLLT